MSRERRNRGNQNNSNNRSQRRLALAVLIVFIIGFFWFMETDNPAVKSLRDRVLTEQNAEEQQGSGAEDAESDAYMVPVEKFPASRTTVLSLLY